MESLPTRLPGLGAPPLARSSIADMVSVPLQPGLVPRPGGQPHERCKQRTRIWELHHSLHCSIIGTCLTTGELKRVLLRLDVAGAATADDHGVHQLGVMLAGNPKAGARHLQKALDRAHRLALEQSLRAKDSAALAALWDDAVKRGDIPGAYWAVLSHPAATDDLVKRVFGEVHMLSHLVGAANRAEIRRLRRLEQDNAALAATVERQQRQLRDGFTARDETIRRLTATLARKSGEDRATAAAVEDAPAFAGALARQERRLVDEAARRERLALRLDKVAAERDEVLRLCRAAEREREALRAEVAALESQLAALLPHQATVPTDALDLTGRCVLYVGGRANQVPCLRGLVERTNGGFLHHDGGLEHKAALLPGLVSRADLVLFPVDCVSHDAAAAVKRACRALGKRYVPLRTSSLACLISRLSAETAESGSADCSASA